MNNDFGLDEEMVHKLIAAFYQQVKSDDLIGPMYPENDWEGAEQRLRDFLIYRFGGSNKYIEERGHPRLRARHIPFKIGVQERDRWLELMNKAIETVDLPDRVIEHLRPFFAHVADFMRNQPEG